MTDTPGVTLEIKVQFVLQDNETSQGIAEFVADWLLDEGGLGIEVNIVSVEAGA